MVIENPDAINAAANAGGVGGANNVAHPSGIPQDQIDNIMSGIANTGDVKMNNHRKKLRQRFDIIKKLGQGTYGKVQLGINKETGQEVAIKTIKKCKIEAEADLVRIRREVQIMSSVQHPNIIHIYEVFENREKMVLVMEFAAGGELYDYLSERKVLSEEEARRIFRQVATAVYYCHKHKICHRDLKLENILLDENGNAKIADFGLSNVFDDQRMLATFCGSPLYASPEIVEGTPYQGPEVDCWSLGVLLYTLVYGSMPFDGSNFKRLVKQISQGDYYEPKKPSRASSLIRDMLTVCPRKRATIEQICSHWWVNENDNVSCLDLAEDLANQTPVRLDVLLSLTPATITADQLVVPSADSSAVGKGAERVPRSHSVGSIRDMGANTEAERRILDMVAAGGEAALMPSPTRTITPAQSPVQTKRKLESTVSTENAIGAQKKKEKPGSSELVIGEETTPLSEETPMETDDAIVEEPKTPAVTTNASRTFSQKDMKRVGDLCEQLIQEKDTSGDSASTASTVTAEPTTAVTRQKTVSKLDAVEEAAEEKDATKVIKKFVNKHKTADLITAIGQSIPSKAQEQTPTSTPTPLAQTPNATAAATAMVATTASKTGIASTPATTFVRKCSLQDEAPLNKFNAERRKSRILETAEKFQQMNAGSGVDKPKKVSIPGVSVGSFKKEYERKASTTNVIPAGPTAGERRAMEEVAAAAAAASELENAPEASTPPDDQQPGTEIEGSDSKNSVASLSLKEARRSMENSIALLRQAQNESAHDVDQLCAQTENIGVNDAPLNIATTAVDRERKLKNARTIIGNAIQPAICRPEPPQAPPPSPQLPSFFGRIAGGGGVGGVGGGNKSSNSNGIGGYSAPQMRSVIGDGGFVTANATSGRGRSVGFDNSKSFKNSISYTQPPQSSTVQSSASSKSQPSAVYASFPPPTTTATQKAAARQAIMERLAAAANGGGSSAGVGAGVGVDISSGFSIPHTGRITQTAMPGAYHHHRSQLQKQQSLPQQQYQQEQQPQPQNLHQHQYHRNMSIGSSPQIPIAQPPPPPQSPSSLASAIIAAAATKHTKNANATTTTTTTTATIQNSVPKPFYNASNPSSTFLKSSPGGEPQTSGNGTVKTSTASITLKSATLPRRKTAKTEIQLDIKPRIIEQPSMRFTTEMQHPVPDLRSAPAREGPLPYSPIKTTLNARASSLEPKEHIIPIQRQQPPYTRTTSNTTNRSGSLSRQSTADSESDTATNLSQSTITGSSQPIKKSPREFIIPIAMEGGGFITPREGSIEPSDSSHTAASSRNTFSRLRPTRRIGSLLSEASIDENSPFQKMRTTSANRDGDDDTRFTLHKLRSSRPMKKISQDNDSQSSGEEDDDDGFEILTAENLFSTLLQRVRALTNRLNVNNDLPTGFPSSTRLLGNMRQSQSPFWNQEPFGRSQVSYSYSQTVEKKHVRLNNSGAPWRHSMSRDLGNDMESMFSRTGATLPRGSKTSRSQLRQQPLKTNTCNGVDSHVAEVDAEFADGDVGEEDADTIADAQRNSLENPPLDLADLDLSRLRLSKKDLETLSSITPGLPKCFQEQLLAKLPPTQARKLSRTLSMQNSPHVTTVKVYKRSQSSGRHGTLPEAEGAPSLPPPPPALEEEPKESEQQTLRSQLYRRSLSRQRNEYQEATTTATTNANANATTFESPSTAAALKSRSNSVCRDDYGKSLSGVYTSDMSEKYRYQSPYLNRSLREPASTNDGRLDGGSSALSPQRRYVGASSAGSMTLPRDFAASRRPPSGCLSPPAIGAGADGSSSLRRPTSQRRISRFLRPDFFDEEVASEESAYQREKKLRERETQSLLREIREKSRESSMERYCNADSSVAETLRRKYKQPIDSGDGVEESEFGASRLQSRHARNRSLDMYSDETTLRRQQHRRSLSRPRDICEELDKHELADKILQELQLLSAVRSQQEQRLSVTREMSAERTLELESTSVAAVEPLIVKSQTELYANVTATTEETNGNKEKTGTIKKVKKVKPKEKEKVLESTLDGCGGGEELKLSTTTNTTTTVVKKVKKIIKKSTTDTTASASAPAAPTLATPEDMTLSPVDSGEVPKRESKLKRPKSYPTKESAPVPNKSELPTTKLNKAALTSVEGSKEELTSGDLTATTATLTTTANTNVNMLNGAPRESRLVRPKSYPASKLTPPKESKKITRSGVAIPSSISEACADELISIKSDATSIAAVKSAAVAGAAVTNNSTTTATTTVKKVIKKKSKLVQPMPLTPTSPTTSGSTMPAGEETPKESSPTLKEKSPEKKTGKGLLYAIGQKFEKLRDSAMSSSSKEKKTNIGITSAGPSSCAIAKKSTPESSSPEKIKEKSVLVKKKIVKTDKTAIGADKGVTNSGKVNSKTANGDIAEKPTKGDKRSRIDAMIRSLRERSVPRCNTTSESNYLKRAVSVEEMPGTFNRNAVNKVLGLFRRFEKDGSGERRVRSTRSTSNIERQMRDSSPPTSPIYQNAMMERDPNMKVKTKTKPLPANSCVDEAQSSPNSTTSSNCPDCQHQAAAAAAAAAVKPSYTVTHAQTGNKDKRKGLMLDLENTGKLSAQAKAHYMMNGNGIYSNLPPYPGALNNVSNNSSSQQSNVTTITSTNTTSSSMDNNNITGTNTNTTIASGSNATTTNNNTNNNSNNSNNNNNNNSNNCHITMHGSTSNNNNNNNNTSSSQTSGYRTSSAHEINRNHLLTPSTENMANYSSDSRSYQDDCASTSTFLSPTEEPELCFDNWSICSEDNYMLHATPSPTVSRLSRTSQQSPTRCDSSDPNESVIERIKRRSFYCRFNDKKPRRTSSIVGPTAVRDYYREQQQHRATAAATIATAVGKTRSSHKLSAERSTSPDITHEFFRPLKLSPIGTELKPPVYRSPHDYSSSSSASASAAAVASVSASTAAIRKSRKSLTDIRPTPITNSSSFRRYGIGIGASGSNSVCERDDYISITGGGGGGGSGLPSARYKSSSSNSPYESNGDATLGGGTGTGGGYYSTYNPKRRSSYTMLNGSAGTKPTATSSSTIDSYATLGRRSIRAYDQRTRSLLDPHTIAMSNSSGSASTYLPRRDTRTPVRDYTASMSRSSTSRYRTSSVSRSPTNI